MATDFRGMDYIDSRDVEEAINELESDIECKEEEIEDVIDDPEQTDYLAEELEELKEELELLTDFRDNVGSSEWNYGLTLINEDSWVDYCEELCKDIGDLPSELPWYIENNIDWDGVADAIRMDYSKVEFDGNTYYYRD